MIVFGTRPEAIKMAPLVNAINAFPQEVELTICITSQHRQMLDQVLEIFNIKPNFDLNVMKINQSLANLTSVIINKMHELFKEYRPDIILVHGDTTTSFASALAAFYNSIPVGHVEAGLRTNDINSPFPEEFNRQVTSKISKWHFAPTVLNKKNLLSEGVRESSIIVCGNTVIDALYWTINRIETDHIRKENLVKSLNHRLNFNWITEKFILVTAHRRENFGIGILNICEAIKKLSQVYVNTHFIYPVHLNPNIKNTVFRILGNIPNIHLIEPLDYEPLVYLLKHTYLVLTDSGGIQEEAPSLGKPVLLMRNVTERPEGVDAGVVILVGANRDKIFNEVSKLLNDDNLYQKMSKISNPYGNGTTSKTIVMSLLTDYFMFEL